MRRKRRGNSRFFVYFFTIIFILFGIQQITVYFLKKVSIFKVRKIEIVGTHNLSNLEELVEEYVGKNLFDIEKQEIILNFENLVRIEEINLRKKLPSTLQIIVKERLGKFYVKTEDGHIYPIDKNKIILDNNDFYLREDLPIISTNLKDDEITIAQKLNDEFVDNVFKLHEKICEVVPEMEKKISEYYSINGKIYFVEMNSASHIYLGSKNFQESLANFKFYYENSGLPERKIIDFRYKNQIVSEDYHQNKS